MKDMWIECEDPQGVYRVHAADVKKTLFTDDGLYVWTSEAVEEEDPWDHVVGTSEEYSSEERSRSLELAYRKLGIGSLG